MNIRHNSSRLSFPSSRLSFPNGTAVLLMAIQLVSWSTATGQLTGIGYNITPSGEQIFFDGNSGLGDGTFYGGKLGFSFGEFSELRGIYMRSASLSTDFSDFSGIDSGTDALLGDLAPRDLTLERYGGEVKFNIGRGSLFPTLSVGTGIMRFKPDGLENSETVYLEGAVGIQYSLRDRYTLSLEMRDLAYRYNPASTLLSEFDLSDVGANAEDFELRNVNNLGVSLGLQLYLGGRSRGELTDFDRALRSQFSGGLRGVRLQIEPFGSEISFKSDLGYQKRQRMAGVSAGLDLGSYVGVRGFYWRGIEDGSVTRFDELQAYGGEMRLGFGGESSAIRPFITLGGGYMDVLSDYEGNGFFEPDDRPFAMAGGGVIVPLGETLNIHGSARAILMSTQGTDNVSDPSSISASGMYSVGLSFSIGGRGRSAGGVFEERVGRSERSAREGEARLTTQIGDREKELRSAEARLDSLAQAVVLAQKGDQEAIRFLRERQAVQDSLLAAAAARGEKPVTTAIETPAAVASTPVTTEKRAAVERDRWVTLPVPVEGELYVRYGTPGGVTVETLNGDATEIVIDPVSGRPVSTSTRPSAPAGTVSGSTATSDAVTGAQPTVDARPLTAEEIAQIVRSTMKAEMAAGTTAAQPAADVSRLETMIEDRLASIERSLAARPTVVSQPPATTIVQEEAPAVTTVRVKRGMRVEGAMGFTGVQIDNNPEVLLGLRGDLRQGSGNARFIPELVFGFGKDVSFGIHANGAITVAGDRFYELRPYLGGGFGMINNDGLELTFNLLVGVERTFGGAKVFTEYMTSDFFDYNRVILGYRLAF